MTGADPDQIPLDEVDLLLLKGAADTGTIAGAARTVGLTCSVAERRLSRLARRLDATLLSGDPQRVRLTPAGHTLLAAGWSFLGAIASAAQQVSDMVAGRPTGIPRLRLAGFGRNWDGFADDLSAHLPGVLLEVCGGEPAAAAELYDRYGVDAVYAWQLAGRHLPLSRSAAMIKVLDEPLWVAVSASHPCAGQDRISLGSLAADRWITGPTAQTQQLIHAVCTAAGFVPHIGHLVESAATARSMISHGVGVSLVSPLTAAPAGGAGVVLRPLHAAPRRRHVLAFDPAVVGERLGHFLVRRLRIGYAETATRRNPDYRDSPEFPMLPVAPPGEADPSLLATLRAADNPADAGRKLGLDDLRLLRVVCRAGSLNRAARVLLISQPALSRRIHRLERNLGITLFVRSYRGTELAAAANDLLAEIAGAEAAFREALRAIRGSGPDHAPPVMRVSLF